MKKTISYILENQTTPDFVFLGGQYLNGERFLGISKDDAILSENVIIYDTKEDLLHYLLSYTQDWMEQYNHPLGVMHPGTIWDTRPFNAENAADYLCSLL